MNHSRPNIKNSFSEPFVFAIHIFNAEEIISLGNSITGIVKKNSTGSPEVITRGFSEGFCKFFRIIYITD